MKYPRVLLKCGFHLLKEFLFYVIPYARHPERYPLDDRYRRVRSLIVYVFDHFRVDSKIEGIENLRALEKNGQSFLLTCNHESDFDALAIIYYCEKPLSVIAKKETRGYPFIGTAIKAIDGLFMDRSDLRQSFEVIKTAQERIAKGYCSYLIFPEGTRNKEPVITPVAPYHPGSFKTATTPKCPILPVSMYGAFRMFKSHPDYKRNPLEISFMPSLSFTDYQGLTTQALATKVYEMTEKANEQQKKEDRSFFKHGYQKIPLKKGPVR
jgi:1-acyl-sn-glycerol-3-phosphate acyltransferase